ncbi:MAG: outer membrane beta-barrel protein [Pirellulales bacterium]
MRKIGGLILGVLALTGLAKADNSFSEIDLTSFQDIPSIIDACDVPIENVSCSTRPNCRRFYITGLWGVSAATLDNLTPTRGFDTSANIFTAGIAGGVSLERERGRLRLEAEWLQRDFYRGAINATPGASLVTSKNWSVLANVWRDFMVTEKFGCYGGGGIGGGGITGFGEFDRVPATDSFTSSAFAWQAGGGLIYEVTDQVTFDVSYRWYQVNGLSSPPRIIPGPTLDYRYGASQVMFSLRMFEPLRSLLR